MNGTTYLLGIVVLEELWMLWRPENGFVYTFLLALTVLWVMGGPVVMAFRAALRLGKVPVADHTKHALLTPEARERLKEMVARDRQSKAGAAPHAGDI